MNELKQQEVGIYLHIPFCTRKCPYCDFYSVAGDGAVMDAYTDALCAEMDAAPAAIADSLYLGGGTPILLGANRLIRLLQKAQQEFCLTGEITLEANPNVSDFDTLLALRQAGFNRVSFGMQSANEQELAVLGRQHTPEQVCRAVLAASRAGFEDISVDLMIGTPHQTVDSLCNSIDFLSTLPLTHISAYLLKVEPNTAFQNADVLSMLPDEDTVSDSYLTAVRRLETAGFRQYEISNFAKPGHESLHNLKYWQCRPYLGFGPAASGFFDGVRYTHPRDIEGYLANHGQTAMVEETAVDPLAEAIMLGLRLTEGIDLSALSAMYPFDLQQAEQLAGKYARYGLLRKNGCRIALTPEGFLLSNSILADFLAQLTL